MDRKAAVAGVAELLAQGGALVLSGAGLSTGAGIPDYRDRDGSWKRSQPIRHGDFLASEAVRRRYWARSCVGWPVVQEAVPTGGHRAIAELQRRGLLAGIVTQNVDGLHQKAGCTDVIELHGTIGQVICLSCQRRGSRRAMQLRLLEANPWLEQVVAQPAPDGDALVEEAVHARLSVPPCPDCGGLLKPDVVFFGDSVPRERVGAAMALLAAARFLMVVGSSLMVYSGYRFALRARELGIPVVAINDGTTRADDLLLAKVGGDCGAALHQLLNRVA